MSSRFNLVVVLAALSPFIGCSASVNGEVDGNAVAALVSVLFVEDEDDIGDDTLTSVTAIAVSFFDGCNVLAKRQANANELREQLLDDLEDAEEQDDVEDALDEFATGIVEYDEQNLPTDYWIVSVGVSALDEDDIDGGDAEIDFNDPDLDADVQGSVTVCRVNDHPEVDEDDLDQPTVDEDADCYAPLEADIEVKKYEPEETFETESLVTLASVEEIATDDDPRDVGDVTINISAAHCKPLQDALDDAEDIEEDAANP
jgi:hypothetical protein